MFRTQRLRSVSSDSRVIAASILLIVFLFVAFGLIMVYNVSVVEAASQFNDKLYFARQQLRWAGIAVVALLVAVKIPSKWWIAGGPIVFLGALLLLVAVLIPGIGMKVGGARRWLDLGFTQLQPAELMKLGLALYLSTWLTRPRTMLSFAVLIGIIFGLIMVQPDLGTSLIIVSIAAAMYFVSGKPLADFGKLAGLGVLGICILILMAPYRLSRVQTFLNPESDPLGKSYHIRQITIALGNGGLFGQGLGKSIQKYRYIPEAATDSIFAVIAEEVGFVGCGIIIIGYIVLFTRMIAFVQTIEKKENVLLATGIVTWFGAQVIVNLSSVVALIPLTGVPLPFISYGGSALVSQLLGIGILLGLARQEKSSARRKSL